MRRKRAPAFPPCPGPTHLPSGSPGRGENTARCSRERGGDTDKAIGGRLHLSSPAV